MAEFFKVLRADPLGEPWTPQQAGAKAIQNFWCQIEGQEQAVSVGRQVDNPLRAGMHIYGDLLFAKSQKGKQYWRFRGAKVPEGVSRPTDDPSTPAQATAQQATGRSVDMSAQMPDWFQAWANTINDIYKMVKELHGGLPEEPKKTGVEVIAGTVDQETKDTLDEIFGDTPEPIEE